MSAAHQPNPHHPKNRRNGRHRRFARTADRIAGLTDPSMGDERERDVILRAGTVAWFSSIFIIQLIGICLAATGAGLWSGLVMVAAGVPGAVYGAYCGSEGLDNAQIIGRVAPRRRRIAGAAGIVAVAVWLGLLAFHYWTGTPIVDLGAAGSFLGFLSPEGSSPSFLIGGVIGAAISLLVLERIGSAGRRRAAAEQRCTDDED